MPVKVYISQANQAANIGPGGYTEKAGMEAISKRIAAIFADDSRFLIRRNKAAGVDTAVANCDEANRWGADYYVALHSNAGMKGTVVFHYSTSPKGKRLAQCLYRELAPLSPGSEAGSRVQAKDGFIEIHRPKAPAVLVEIEAHDWAIGVAFLTKQREAIARALYVGICRGVGLVPLPEPVPAPSVPSDTVTVKMPRALWKRLRAWFATTKA